MRGLLERTQTLIASKRARQAPGESSLASELEESGVTPDERRELLAKIEQLFTERRPIQSTESGKRRGGGLFPLVVNLGAAALLATGIILVGRFGQVAERANSSGGANYLTTEGLVVKSVQKQAQAELSQREARIAQITKELESLRTSSGSALNTAAAARQKQLQSELAALQADATARLSALNARRDQQTFLIRQLQAIYQNIGSDVNAGNLAPALDGISSADSLLAKSSSDPTGEVAAVAPALVAGNAVLRTAILYGQSAMKAAQSSQVSAQIAAIDRLVQQGDARYQANDLGQASALYTKAITSLASLSRAFDRLQKMTADGYDRKTGEMAAEIDSMKQNVASLEATIKRQNAAMARQESKMAAQQELISGQQRTISEQAGRLSSQGSQIAAQQETIAKQRLEVQRRTEELATVVNSVQSSIAQSAPENAGTKASDSSRQVVDLLKTKVAIRWLADTPEARKTYPDLYAQLDPFFRKYAETYSTQGRKAALNEVASALNDVILTLNLKLPANPTLGTASPVGQAEHGGPYTSGQIDPVSGYLSKVGGVLGGMLHRLD